MARNIRLEFPGAIYHVINRGDRREPIFQDAEDRCLFLETLSEACEKTKWVVHAYCLLPNHFHLVIETPNANLVAGMKWFMGTYTQRFNRRHNLTGHLFAGRYKALVVDHHNAGYFRSVCNYVHLNPVRARLISDEMPLHKYPWCSVADYLANPMNRKPWLQVDRLLKETGIPKDDAAGRRAFRQELDRLQQGVEKDEWTELRRGWCWGSEDFRKELLDQMKPGRFHAHAEKLESAEQRGRLIIEEELAKLQWEIIELKKRDKSHSKKVTIAYRLRKETTLSYRWIADELTMGTGANVAKWVNEMKKQVVLNSGTDPKGE